MVNLTTNYLGLTLKNPLIAGSSGMTDSVQGVKAFAEAGVGAIVLRSLFEEEILLDLETSKRKLAANAFIYPESLEFYEDADHHKETTTSYLDLIYDAKQAVDVPVIASINCVSASQWTYFPKRIQEAGADAIELNLFIMPSDFNRSAEENEKQYFAIIEEVLKNVTIPVSLKISPYFSNLGQMANKFADHGAKGLVLFNRFYNPDFDIDDLTFSNTHVLSAPSDIVNTMRWTALLSGRVKCDLAASTGVHSSEALIKMLLAGSTAVQAVSTFYKNGAGYAATMLKELSYWMEARKYQNIDDFRGMMNQANVANPAAYERVQFMKYFRTFNK